MTQNSINKTSSSIEIDTLQINNNTITTSSGTIVLDTLNSDEIQFTDGTDILVNITPNGQFTTPLQPAFLAYANISVTSVTGSGTEVVVNFNIEEFDIGNNFSSSNLFTAPITGKYMLGTNVTFTNLSAAMTSCRLSVVTSNSTFEVFANAFAMTNGGALGSISLNFSCNMDIGDTAQVFFRISNGASDTADINGSGDLETYFYGKLLG
jgi:hypothetical protein